MEFGFAFGKTVSSANHGGLRNLSSRTTELLHSRAAPKAVTVLRILAAAASAGLGGYFLFAAWLSPYQQRQLLILVVDAGLRGDIYK